LRPISGATETMPENWRQLRPYSDATETLPENWR